ncbi:malate dehydrogenase [Striga asiatica]|uniref:Malate dehydrogenase n=1 Tax=Striga asiatica TaxID=4170 RepID=A0A5A7PBD7_STRAF|nr:malate dehydrogenase [Striga asiatica]
MGNQSDGGVGKSNVLYGFNALGVLFIPPPLDSLFFYSKIHPTFRAEHAGKEGVEGFVKKDLEGLTEYESKGLEELKPELKNKEKTHKIEINPSNFPKLCLAEVGLGNLVDVVGVKAVELVDDRGELVGEGGEEAADAGENVVVELRREEVVGDGADNHGSCGIRARDGEDFAGGVFFLEREKGYN